jgi:hypothetical protein
MSFDVKNPKHLELFHQVLIDLQEYLLENLETVVTEQTTTDDKIKRLEILCKELELKIREDLNAGLNLKETKESFNRILNLLKQR